MNEIRAAHVLNGAFSELSEADLASIEDQLGYPLPGDYREFLRKYGVCAGRGRVCFTSEDDPSEVESSVEVFLGSSPGDYYDVVGRRQDIDEELLPAHLIPVATSPGGEFCLSLDGPDKGCVYWWNQHGGSFDWRENAEFIYHSFHGFVNSLVLTESDGDDE